MKSRQQKRDEAAVRQAAYDALSIEQKFQRAIARGHHGTREARRLAELLRQEGSR
jgi:hypothetical protein